MKEQSKFELFSNLNGGLSTRPTTLLVDSGKKMQSPDLKNVNFFRTGGISKRLGKTQQGDTLTPAGGATFNQAGATTYSVSVPNGEVLLCMPFTTVGAVTLGSLEVNVSASFSIGGINATGQIYSQVSSLPGVLVGDLGSTTLISSITPALITFSGTGTVALSALTTYWLVVRFIPDSGQAYTVYYKGQAGTLGRLSVDGGSNFTDPSKDIFFNLYSSTISAALQGVYDYRPTPTTRQQLAVMDGVLYKRNKSGSSFINTWTALFSSFATGQDILSSFATLKDYVFVSNFAQVVSRVWDGLEAYTIKQGFQATFSAADAAGSAAMPDGVYKVMAVTTLKSGGYRASAPVTVTLAGGGNQKIAVTSIVADGTGATNFGFDIDTLATKWFMTAPGGATYYKIPTAMMSTGTNPNANNVTSFDITNTTGLTSANTLIVEYSLPQGYFTSQVATPAIKYQTAWQDFLVMAGDPNYPSRVWFSEQNAPNIWSTYGQVYGNFLEIDDGDGDVITGVFQWNGSLYVSKQHSLHIIEFTGNAQAPFQRRRLPGDIGALSGFTFKDVGAYFVFLSERGIAGCVGSIVNLAPGMDNILNLFDPNDTDRFNLSACAYSTAGHNRVLGQVWFGVSSTSSTTRDKVLIFDYGNKCFWLDDGISGNYFTEVGDANGFFRAWSGDYSGQVFAHDSGLTDNGAAIDWYFTTPHLGMKDPYAWKEFDKLVVAGDKQTSGTLSIDLYVDRSTTLTKTITIDMTAERFKTGFLTQLGVRAKTLQLKFRNAETSVPVQIDSFGIYFRDIGVQA